ncbi:MAG: BON domain-containing protein [Burkholderia sp.]|uniref:BON domain-containing protein n=1 Tax=Burkholderia sp. TaxID=36773 RepID=UPI00281C1D67|nr:BON domain-containing protein [Burkholderia sp.]MDR0240435.1 BON domain-containing protein [Burkholderia sp.]
MTALQRILIVSAVTFGIAAVSGVVLAASDRASAAASGGTSAAESDLPASANNTRHAGDRGLTRRVSAALAHTRGLNATRIMVLTRNGVVTLRGSVGDGQQAEMAVDAARRIDGVTQVTNQLRLVEQIP